MADIVDKETRSRWMKGIGAKDTRPERVVRSVLHRAGLRFRLNVPDLPGKPDIVLPRFRTCVLVHGCYWHRHTGCRLATTPSTRQEFWLAKLNANKRRDKKTMHELLAMGWRVIVIWECGIGRHSAGQELQWLPDEIRRGDLPLFEWPDSGGTLPDIDSMMQ